MNAQPATPYWEDTYWINPPFDEYRIVEIDIRTFTPEGTLAAAEEQLSRLRSEGVTALMLNNIEPFAREQPARLRHFVDSCHYEGIAVSIDVADVPVTPTASRSVAPLIEKATAWFRDFHIDALRLNGLGERNKAKANRLLQSLRDATNQLTARTGRQYYLLVDCEASPVAVMGRYVKRFLCKTEQPKSDNEARRAYRRDFLYESRFGRALTDLFKRVA